MMLREHRRKSSKKRGPTRYPGIVRHASQLGVSRIHLWYVLTGQRDSKPLLRRYHELKEAA
jgi:16S rRNA U1498 N3-methylase RsmE